MLIRLLLPQMAWDELSYQDGITPKCVNQIASALSGMRWTELPRLNFFFFYSQASEVLKNLSIDLLLWLPNHRYSMSSYGPGANLKFPQEKFDIYFMLFRVDPIGQWSKTTTGEKEEQYMNLTFQNRRSPGAIREPLSGIVSNKIAVLLLLLLVQR